MARTRTTHRSDADIFVEARHALDCRPTVPGTVHVHIDKGVATLTGTVGRPGEKADAADAVGHVPGVKDVVNIIIVMQTASAEGFEPPDDRG
jgi:osmotically-inducible protein OsmY